MHMHKRAEVQAQENKKEKVVCEVYKLNRRKEIWEVDLGTGEVYGCVCVIAQRGKNVT